MEKSTTNLDKILFTNQQNDSNYSVYVQRLKKRIQDELQCNDRQIEAHSEQISRLIHRVTAPNKQTDDSTPAEKVGEEILIDPTLVNRLRTENVIHEIVRDQTRKIDKLNKEFDIHTWKVSDEQRVAIFYRTKRNFISSKWLSRDMHDQDRVEQHMLHHTSICLIGQLAAGLPMTSANADDVWAKLMKPLNEVMLPETLLGQNEIKM